MTANAHRTCRNLSTLVALLAVVLMLSACSSAAELGVDGLAQPQPTAETESSGGESPAAQPQAELGVFNLVIDGQVTSGSGIVFATDTEYHVRGLAGTPGQYFQFDHVLARGEELSVLEVGSSIAEVFGGDATQDRFVVVDGEKNEFGVSTEVTALGDSIWGQFVFPASDVTIDGDDATTISGQFNLLVGDVGDTDWDCDWTSPLIADCGFIE